MQLSIVINCKNNDQYDVVIKSKLILKTKNAQNVLWKESQGANEW